MDIFEAADISSKTEEERRTQRVALNLQTQIRKKKISRKQLSEKAEVTEATLSRILRGQSKPLLITTYKICQVVGCELTDLFQPVKIELEV